MQVQTLVKQYFSKRPNDAANDYTQDAPLMAYEGWHVVATCQLDIPATAKYEPMTLLVTYQREVRV